MNKKILKKHRPTIAKPITRRFIVILVVFATILGFTYYQVAMHIYGEDFEAYSESSYEYLYEISDKVIGKYGINIAAIPEDVVKYEITYENGEIIFKYSLDTMSRIVKYAPSITVTLSKNFEVLSKIPNFSSKEEYVIKIKDFLYATVIFEVFLTLLLLFMVELLVTIVLCIISIIHKKKT